MSNLKQLRVRYPLRHKLLLLMVTMLLAAILSYLVFAIQIFKEDRRAYIFEGSTSLVKSISFGIESHLKTLRNDQLALLKAVEQSPNHQLTSEQWEEFSGLMAWSVYQTSGENLGLTPQALQVKGSGIVDEELVRRMEVERPLKWKQAQLVNFYLDNPSVEGGRPVVRSVGRVKDPQGDRVIATYYSLDSFAHILFKSETYNVFLVNNFGEVLVHKDENLVVPAANILNNDRLSKFFAANTETGAFEYLTNSGEENIVSINKLPNLGLAVLGEIPSEKAYLAIHRIQEKSLVFSLLLIALFFIVAVTFSSALTKSLRELFDATKKVGQGDFDIELGVKTNDELGALSTSFNSMASQIKHLLDETVELARMEKELETAHFVQDNLFPTEEFTSEDFDLSAFYKPASECGGDWWSYKKIGDQLVVCVGDATGHGVPAALITAAAQSSFNTVFEVTGSSELEKLDPATLLRYLNVAIYKAGKGQVKMTFFIGILNLKTGALRYANASHEMPLVCHKATDSEEYSKEDIDAISGKPGTILGADESSEYKSYKVRFSPGDSFVIYTDGLTEGRSEEDEEWGERRLIRTLTKADHNKSASLKDTIINKAYKFYGSRAPDDDITLVVGKFSEKAELFEEAA